MKNLSNVDIHEFLSRCPIAAVENYMMVYEDKEYAVPYSTMKIQNKLIKGLRENVKRVALFEGLIRENTKDASSYLDIGSNLGVFVKSYDHLFDSVEGLDVDQHCIEQCAFLYPEIKDCFTLVNLNVTKLSDAVKEEKDVITALSMIEYVNDKQEFIKDLFNLTKQLCIVEGHSEDINIGADLRYEALLREQPWTVARLEQTTDAGTNAPQNTQEVGRPVWICKK
jgi:hypothetical protein